MVIIGTPKDQIDYENGYERGSIYTFLYNASDDTWKEQQKLIVNDGVDQDHFAKIAANDEGAGKYQGPDGFGISVSIDHSIIIIGAPFKGGAYGGAYLFLFDNTTNSWNEEK
eukprot:CAMPEP_0183730660 /NCGR_PEP_ID=MMETSP0737-20130205/33429_1 /TAXON_ID=385413 /ORGANISM="Thalassiosira miniscula, Strain CCMP1093" /LENGTH=111 /DNA_ID=CAMNT_0025963213 /DNA_START=35 /DNA_END=368 /DNA_ORIENTATION=+